MWTATFCPNFTIWSFTFLNVIIQFIVFLASLFYTQSLENEEGFAEYMLWGNREEALQRFGMRMPWRIKDANEWYRLLLSLYVNHGFSQFAINCLAQLFAGFILEGEIGSCRMCILWFSAGISANLFACVADDDYAAGAEPAMFAMICGLIASYIYYWEKQRMEIVDAQMRRGEEPHDPFCEMLCGFIIRIVLLIIAIFLLSSFA